MTDVKYRECQLGTWIIPHIIRDLWIKRYLAERVLEYHDIQTSVRTTFIPEDLDMKTLEKDYLNLDTCRSTTIRWVARKVQEFILSKDDHIVILEHPCSAPSDPWIKTQKVPIISFRDDVLLDIYGRNSESIEYIEKRIQDAEGASYLFGVMSSLPKSRLPLSPTLDEDTIVLLAKRCESLILSAFDGTGYILCSFNK